MLKRGLAVSVLGFGAVIVGCDSGHDKVGEATDTRGSETVVAPILGAVDRAHGVEDVAAGHNKALDEALRDSEYGKDDER